MRLKHVLLLALRVLIILGIISLIASPFLPGAVVSDQADLPTAVVVIIDTSGSMRAKNQGAQAVKKSLAEVAKLVDKLPSGSKVAIVDSQSPSQCLGFSVECSKSANAIKDYEMKFGSLGISASLPRALNMLKKSNLSRKMLIIVSDLAKSDWENLQPVKIDGCKIVIFEPTVEQKANYSIELMRTPTRTIFAGSAMPVVAKVASQHASGEVNAKLYIGDKLVESIPVNVSPNAPSIVRFLCYPKESGMHVGRVVIDQPDCLTEDNQRFFNFEVAQGAKVIFVQDPQVTKNDTALLMKYAINPPIKTAQNKVQASVIAPDGLAKKDIFNAKFIVLAGLPGLTSDQWENLYDYVHEGGNLWIVPGDYTNRESYNTDDAQKLMPAKLANRESFDLARKLGEIDYTDDYLKPFARSGSNPPLQDLRFYQRYQIGSQAPGVYSSMSYEDKTPAMLTRRVGKGRVLLWNFSPARSWSNLATLGGQLIVLSTQTKSIFLAPDQIAGQVDCGTVKTIELPQNCKTSLITIKNPQSKHISPKISRDKKTVVIDQIATPGVYQVELPLLDKVKFLQFSANMPIAESDFTKIDSAKLKQKFPAEALAVVENLDQLTKTEQKLKISLNLVPIALIILLVLMILENMLANKFYQKELNESENSEQIAL